MAAFVAEKKGDIFISCGNVLLAKLGEIVGKLEDELIPEMQRISEMVR